MKRRGYLTEVIGAPTTLFISTDSKTEYRTGVNENKDMKIVLDLLAEFIELQNAALWKWDKDKLFLLIIVT